MTNGTTTLGQFESHLWEAANILRGPVDAADCKTCVFPLPFFKRISGWYRDYKDVEGVALVATFGEIAGNEHKLCIPRCVAPQEDRTVLTVGAAVDQLKDSVRAAFRAEDKLIAILKREGLLVEEGPVERHK